MLSKLYRTLTGSRTRLDYWSTSNFADIVRQWGGLKVNPPYGTSEEWNDLEKYNKSANPFVNWVVEEGFDFVQDVVYFIPDVYHNIRYKLRLRFVKRFFCLDTKLSRWEYLEIDTRILHGLFETLVDFVEIEKAHLYKISNDQTDHLSDREAGLAHLEWEMELTDADFDGPGDPTPQAIAAREIKDLYVWWKDIYPNRPDPYDVTGWTEYCASKEYPFAPEKDDAERMAVRAMLKNIQALVEQQENEETEMLIRLIKIRKEMWT